MTSLDLADEIQSLSCAYDSLCSLAGKAQHCDAEQVGHVLYVLNRRLEELGQQAVKSAFADKA